MHMSPKKTVCMKSQILFSEKKKEKKKKKKKEKKKKEKYFKMLPAEVFTQH